jgi:glyoxylase-like metal-dependent hydrolase (beta-lactamase superfamily II)
MTSDIYRFTVGAIECIVVGDGTFVYPSSVFAVNAPIERFEQELQDHNLPQRELVIPYSCFFVNTGKHLVLVDTGAGFAPTNGKLLQNLAAAGIKAGDIDTVVLTHGHADHIGANVDDAGLPAFPNARYVMWKEEWDFWTQEQPDLRAMPVEEEIKQLLVAYAQRELPPLKGQVEMIDRETEIVPGIRALPAPGHTPGHMVVAISSGTEQLLHIVDTVLHPILMEQPDWYPSLDLLPGQAIVTKRQILDWASTDRLLVAAYHFPFPGLGHVVRWGKGWRWQPVGAVTPVLASAGS